jgi:hypothetical protein
VRSSMNAPTLMMKKWGNWGNTIVEDYRDLISHDEDLDYACFVGGGGDYSFTCFLIFLIFNFNFIYFY